MLDFDASHLYGPAGPLNADDAVYDWEFGDATHTVGQKPRHVFAGWGHFNVSVRITFKNGQMLELGRTVVLTRE